MCDMCVFVSIHKDREICSNILTLFFLRTLLYYPIQNSKESEWKILI